MIAVTDLHCEGLRNPLGIDARNPRLSWRIDSDERDVRQTSYRVVVEREGAVVWDSGRVASDRSVHVRYAGASLESRRRYTWRVRVWDRAGRASDWSAPTWWEMGLLTVSDWRATWIEPEGTIDPESHQPAPFVRTTFELGDSEVASARIYATAHGVYELHLNGEVVGDRVLAPGWTSYHHRLQYQVYDVGALLLPGVNAVGAIIGDGWWRGSLGTGSLRNAYGGKVGFLFQLEIRCTDGSERVITSDDAWKTAVGPILTSDMQEGETYDARLEMPGWATPDFDDAGWPRVADASYPLDNLVAESSPPIRCKEELAPVAVLTTPSGKRVVDFGQNISGRVRFTLRGRAGRTITLHHNESLENGEFVVAKGIKVPFLGFVMPRQAVTYTFASNEIERFESKFTTQGFRYLYVAGYDGEIASEDFRAVAMYSDMERIGYFECSDARINRLHENILWSQKGNFMDVPTDCPTRARGGWTGDAQIFARTGATLMETGTFFTKWLKDLAVDQEPSGRVGGMVPAFYRSAGRRHLLLNDTDGAAGWADASVLIPWTMYRVYGDRTILETQYESMAAWIEYAHSRTKRVNWNRKLSPRYWLRRSRRDNLKTLWDTDFHWGEWTEPEDGPLQIFGGALLNFIISKPLVASAYYKHSCDIMAEVAALLGRNSDAQRYRARSAAVKRAYAAEFVGKDGRIKPDKQASYVRVLAFDLVPDELRPVVVRRLLDLIRKAGNHLGTGFLSTGMLCGVLADEGYLDVAYDLLMQDTIPSWLYAVGKGATTIWEGWNTIKPDGSGGIGSHNHYSKGAVGEWLYRGVAGIEIDEAGYKRSIIRPRPGGGLRYVRASIRSVYGTIGSSWNIDGNRFDLEVEVPPNTTATVTLPDGSDAIEVGSGRHSFSCSLEPTISGVSTTPTESRATSRDHA